MADITLNSAVRSNLRNLQSTTDLLNQTEERLSTGKKVNSALDNPNSFFTAQALDRRASDFSTLLDSVSNSVKTLEAADNGIKAITDVVEGLKATARNALQAPKGAEYVVEADAFTSAATPPVAGAGTFTINGETVTTVATDEISDVVSKINALEGTGVTASLNDDGDAIVLTSDDEITIAAGTTDSAASVGFTPGATAQGTLTITDKDAYDKRQGYLDDYNAALEQIDSLASDASFNGVNLLQGDDLEITFNEDGTSKLNVEGTSFGASGIGLAQLTESASDGALGDEVTAAGAFDTKSGINAVIDKIDAAFNTLEAQSSKFGSQLQIVQTRETFTKDQIGTLEDGALALVGADTNEEAANLATLQTKQSLIVSSLSISTQQESNILQLLR